MGISKQSLGRKGEVGIADEKPEALNLTDRSFAPLPKDHMRCKRFSYSERVKVVS